MKKLIILVLTVVTAMCFVFSACFDNSSTAAGGNTGEHTQQSGDNNNQNDDGDNGDDNSQSDSDADDKDEQPDDGNKDDNQGSGEDNENSGGTTGDNQQGEQGGQESDGDTDDNNELVNAYQDIVDALKTRLAEIKRTDRDLIEILSLYIDDGLFACVAKNNNKDGVTRTHLFKVYADNVNEVTPSDILEATKIAQGYTNYNDGVETYDTNPELLEAMTKKLVGEDYEIIVGGLTEPRNNEDIGYYVFRYRALLKNKETHKIWTYSIKISIDEAKVFFNFSNGKAYEAVLGTKNTNEFEQIDIEPPIELECSEVYELECERVEEAKKAAESK